MGISVGVLALICALVLLFGVGGTRKLLGWTFGVIMLGAAGVSAVVWVWPTLQQRGTAVPVAILPALPSGFALDKTGDVAGKIQVMGPDKRIFVFLAGTEQAAIENYMETVYGAAGSPRTECWAKEPGPWCDYRG